jgi:hypothetical protein
MSYLLGAGLCIWGLVILVFNRRFGQFWRDTRPQWALMKDDEDNLAGRAVSILAGLLFITGGVLLLLGVFK